MFEIWRDIIGYEGLYQVSSLGKVKSLGNHKNRKEKMMRLGVTEKGYLVVGLSKNVKIKKFKVHRLVATAFLPNPKNKPEVNHKGKRPNKKDNRYFMIEWVTSEENEKHAKRHGLNMRSAKLNKEQVLEIKSSNESIEALCLKYNVSVTTISQIKRGNAWKHI